MVQTTTCQSYEHGPVRISSYKHTLAMLSTSWRSKVSACIGWLMDKVLMLDPNKSSVTALSRIYSSSGYFSSFYCPTNVAWDVTQHNENSKALFASITKWKLWNTFCSSSSKWWCNGRIWNSDCIKWAGTPVPSNILNTKCILILNYLHIQIKYIKKKRAKQQIKFEPCTC